MSVQAIAAALPSTKASTKAATNETSVTTVTAARSKVVNLTGRDQPYGAPQDPTLVLQRA